MGTPLRVLIAEDSEDDAALLMRELRRSGYDLASKRVDTPLDMADALSKQEWDIVFADNSMPHFSATAALQLLKESGLDLPFIIVSGTITDEKAVSAMKSGAHDYIIKGNLARLVPAVERELREALVRQTNRQADELLKESEEKYRTLIENIPDVVWRADREGRILFVSPNVTLLCGFTPEEIYAEGSDFWFLRIHPEETGPFKEVYRGIFEDGKPFSIDCRIQKKGGGWIWISNRAVRVFAREGKIYVDGVFTDITRRKRLEQSLADFAFIVSHDLQEPLRKIMMFGERLIRESQPLLDNQGKDFLDRIIKASSRMSELLENLLKYSRVTGTWLSSEPVDLDRLIRDISVDFDWKISETGARLEIGRLPAVKGDKFQLKELFRNLVDNALKFSKKGTPPRVTVEGKTRADGFAEILVRDNGIGFDEKYLDRVFQPFQRLDDRSEYPGTGMGLTICRKIAEHHGGTITAQSEQGKGATFVVILPT